MSAEEEELEEVYNKMFAYRYTDQDPDYVENMSKPHMSGPCVANYFNKPKRNYDQKRGDRDRGGGGRWRGGYQGDNRGQGYNRDRRQDYHGNRGNYDYHGDRSSGRDNRQYGDRPNRDYSNRPNRYQPY